MNYFIYKKDNWSLLLLLSSITFLDGLTVFGNSEIELTLLEILFYSEFILVDKEKFNIDCLKGLSCYYLAVVTIVWWFDLD